MSVYSRWWMGMETILFMFLCLTLVQIVHSSDDVLNRNEPGKAPQADKYRVAEITISYRNPHKNRETSRHFVGKYGLEGKIGEVKGTLVYATRSSSKNAQDHTGCKPYENKNFPSTKWIAIVERGNCNFSDKVRIATQTHNASAVAVYADEAGSNGAIMNVGDFKTSISVYITHEDGKQIMALLKSGSAVVMHISPGEEKVINRPAENNISKTSVLFVSISFIVLMIISLAWLVFYYIQRFRYSHAKERLARRLACAAKKAIAKIPQATVKSGDKVLEGDHDQCAVCIEQYKPNDVIRILPCTHVFHKSCVDPWLQENRSCPMCKMDILVAYGMQIGTSQESVHHNPEPGTATQQLVFEDHDASSSGEEAHAEVVLLPSFCLHFNVESADAEEAQATSYLLGSSEEVEEALHLSSTSLHSASGSGSASVSRVVKKDIEQSSNKEIRALIENDAKADDEVEEEDGNGWEDRDSIKCLCDNASSDKGSEEQEMQKDFPAALDADVVFKGCAKSEEEGGSDGGVKPVDESTAMDRNTEDRVEFHMEPSLSYA